MPRCRSEARYARRNPSSIPTGYMRVNPPRIYPVGIPQTTLATRSLGSAYGLVATAAPHFTIVKCSAHLCFPYYQSAAYLLGKAGRSAARWPTASP